VEAKVRAIVNAVRQTLEEDAAKEHYGWKKVTSSSTTGMKQKRNKNCLCQTNPKTKEKRSYIKS
jgi:hypothetical protein